jgi:hypothetical protein
VPVSETVEFEISYIRADQTVVSRLTLKNGSQRWWHAPGHEPDAHEKDHLMGPTDLQMSSDDLR